MMSYLRNRHFLASDIILLPIAVYTSFVLRLEEPDLSKYWAGLILFTVVSVVVMPLIFTMAGIYSRYWRYASVEELLLLSSAVTASTLIIGGLSLIGAWILPGSVVVPRSIPFIFFLLALVATASPRLIARLAHGYEYRRRGNGRALPVLIVGAGNAGIMMVRELRQNPQLEMEVIGFLDDDPAKQNVRILGVSVMGNHHDIPQIVGRQNVYQVIIAMPTAPGKVIREIVEVCELVGVRVKIIPGIYELLDGKVSVNQLRDVQIEDLLRRQPVQTNISAVGRLIHGKRVLITGGGGSIGSELCRQVLRFEPAMLTIVGHGENSVFTIQRELLKCMPPTTELHAVIADIRFPERINALFEEYRPDIVFHAAAHKHVPLMELNPAEAVTNNILGTHNLLNAAMLADVKHFVMISTDKAVNPTSVMGSSKRVAELLVHQAATLSGKAYVTVRFGNVLGSRGSVVLTFKEQIASGGPVTVTHPEMRRYFMTIPEAVQLVLQAATIGNGGEVFTLDMGEPVKIVDMAHDMIELSGLEVGRDIDVVFTGIRPGEKLYEELFVQGEDYARTLHEKIFIACNASSFVPPSLEEAIKVLESATQRNDTAAILRMLHLLVPQMRDNPPDGDDDRGTSADTMERIRTKVVGV
ncbi:MAG: polysaccharide biosynthesis protein [Chloroflexales bacterium]|nr:polysaccharide biosynthesis protein [Chloroflexales bacterium]